MAIRTVVFDIGNVVLQWDPRFLYRKLFTDDAEMERFLSDVCSMAWHVRHDEGAGFEENAEPLKAEFPEHRDLIESWGARYLEMTPGEVVGTSALIHALKRNNVSLQGLTNMPSSIYPLLRDAYPVLQEFEHTVVSGDEKLIKPGAQIYEILIARAGLEPASTLFIDDSLHNIEAAQALGMRGHHFLNAEGLKAELVDLGLLRGEP